MNNDKFILDATAGFRMMWFNKQHPNTIYLDERPECEPDIVGDFCDLKQFADETFRLIVFDPPHILRKDTFGGSGLRTAYGWLTPETWQDTLKNGFAECWRVLKPYGVLLFKWSNTNIPSNKVLKYAPTKPLFYQITAVKPQKVSGNKHIKDLWFCFMKIPESEKSAVIGD